MIRVGRIIYPKYGGQGIYPSYDGFTNIVVLMKGHTEWGELGPYDLVDEEGVILENRWQFEKVYETVPKSRRHKSRNDKTVIWDHPAEVHIKDGKLTPEYYAWREKGMKSKHAIRYPVGFNHRHECQYALAEAEDGTIDEDDKLDYVESRKRIYVKEYCSLVKEKDKFKELQERLKGGENLLIIEVDGPHQESLDYYKEKYGVEDDFIENSTVLINEDSINIMLNNEKHPFGHGYCLAMALLDKDVEWNK
jgi:hypothetical protein